MPEMNQNQTPNVQVSTHETPNPSTMKFQFSHPVLAEPLEFRDVRDCHSSPLAMKLFGFPWVSEVFLGSDYMTVTKKDWVEWEMLAQPLTSLIQEHFDQGEPVVHQSEAEDESTNDLPVVREIKRCLREEIRPIVAMDGGDIRFVKYEDGVLSLRMMGACSGCPSSQQTLKDGIEVRIRELLPEVKEVVSV